MVATSLRKQLAGVPVEVLPWRESMPRLVQIFRLDQAFNYIMNGVVLAMVGLGILNTILMRVLSAAMNLVSVRLLAFGPLQLAGMILGESLVSRRSASPGTALGSIVHYYVSTFGWICTGCSKAMLRPLSFLTLSFTRA